MVFLLWAYSSCLKINLIDWIDHALSISPSRFSILRQHEASLGDEEIEWLKFGTERPAVVAYVCVSPCGRSRFVVWYIAVSCDLYRYMYIQLYMQSLLCVFINKHFRTFVQENKNSSYVLHRTRYIMFLCFGLFILFSKFFSLYWQPTTNHHKLIEAVWSVSSSSSSRADVNLCNTMNVIDTNATSGWSMKSPFLYEFDDLWMSVAT